MKQQQDIQNIYVYRYLYNNKWNKKNRLIKKLRSRWGYFGFVCLLMIIAKKKVTWNKRNKKCCAWIFQESVKIVFYWLLTLYKVPNVHLKVSWKFDFEINFISLFSNMF